MQQSGHIIAHSAQPRHPGLPFPAFSRLWRDSALAEGGIPPLFKFAWLENLTGFTPRRFKPLSVLIRPLGQKLMQNKQPLHLSLSMVILAISILWSNY